MKNKFTAVEIGIFAVVSLVFLNSAYNLLTDGKLLDGGRGIPITATAEGRGVAGKPSGAIDSEGVAGFAPYQTKCQTSGEVFETGAAKIRILGPFCGSGRQPAGEQVGDTPEPGLIDYRIENTTTRYAATVFSDQAAGKFSTDFIPLEIGKNNIVMEFRYKNGKTYPVDLTVMRK